MRNNLAATYERISDDREGREAGVGRQRTDNCALAAREGLELVGQEYTDNDLSASTRAKKERPAYKRLIADAKAGKFRVIIAYTQGRLTRTPREYEDLIVLATKYGIRFRYVRSPSFDLNTAQGREIGRTMAARAAGEAEETAERVLRAVQERAESGEPHGHGRAYGLTKSGRKVRKKEAERIKQWAAHVLAGGSVLGIAKQLNAEGVPSPGGAAWRSTTVRRILLAPRIAGLRLYTPPAEPGPGPKPEPIEYPGASPKIIPVATWRALRLVLEDPDRRTNQVGTARKWLGTGLYRCGRCPEGTAVQVGGNKPGVRSYRCPRCSRTWKADPIDTWLAGPDGLIEQLLTKEDARDRLLPRPEGGGVDTADLELEAKAIRSNLAELATEYALSRGAVKAALKAGLDAGEQRLQEIEAAIVAAGRVDPLTEVLGDDPVAAWRAIDDLHRRQALIRRIMTITLGTPLRGRTPFSPDRFITVEPARTQ